MRVKLLLATLIALLIPAAVAQAATPLVEGESPAVQKPSNMEWRVASVSGASGGKVLRVISPGTLTATINPSSGQTLVLRDRRDGRGATATVIVDGVSRQQTTNLAASYTERQFGTVVAGQHTVKVKVGNLSSSDYYLDYIGVAGSVPPPPSDRDGDGIADSADQCPDQAGPSPTGCPAPPPADSDGDGVADSSDQCPGTSAGVQVDASGCPIQTPPLGEIQQTEYVTFFSQGDNDPPGSREIAYPADDGYPTVHNQASGTGTYADPITFASSPAFRTAYGVGVRVYVPDLDKYFVLEDQCASCTGSWIDLFIDQDGYTNSQASARQNELTRDYQVLVRPGSGYFVDTSSLMVYP